VRIEELEEEAVEEWTDGSRMDGRAARRVVWDVVALDCHGGIQRIYNLMSQAPRSWIEETLAGKMSERPRTLMWVKGHGGVPGNEEADRKATMEVWMGERMCRPDIVTPADIRDDPTCLPHTFPVSVDRRWNTVEPLY